MIFTPIAIASAGVICILTGYCGFRSCLNSSSDPSNDSDGCLKKRCAVLVEDQVPEEELGIPIRSIKSYLSISNEDPRDYDFESETSDFLESSIDGTEDDFELDDIRLPLFKEEEIDNEPDATAHSPPEVVLLKDKDAIDAYKECIKRTLKSAEGPEVVHVQDLKSKSPKATEPNSEDLEVEMNDFDEEYSKRCQSFMEKADTLGASKKVRFNSIKDVRFVPKNRNRRK